MACVDWLPGRWSCTWTPLRVRRAGREVEVLALMMVMMMMMSRVWEGGCEARLDLVTSKDAPGPSSSALLSFIQGPPTWAGRGANP